MNAKTLLALSLVANLVLVFALANKKTAPPTAPEVPVQVDSGDAKPAIAAQKAEPARPEPEPSADPVRVFGWEAVESPDYKQYIANLRAVGCPEETISDIIRADVGKLFKQKRKEAMGPRKEFEFWKPGNPFFGAANSEKMAVSAKLEKEKNDMLREMGIEPAAASMAKAMLNPLESMLDFLPEDKQSRVMEVMMEAQAKMAKATEGGGRPDPVEMGKAQKAMEESIKSMLSDEEGFDYEMRFSTTANMLRQNLAGFEPSRDEFMKVYQLQKEFDDKHSIFSRGSETPEQSKIRRDDEKALKEAIKAALGDQRSADYEMSQDYKFRQAHTAATRSGLGVEEAKAAWEMRKTAEEQARELRRNKELAKDARDAALAQMRAETEASIKEIYGEQGWVNYRRGNGHSWLNNIYREPAAPEAPVAVQPQ